MEFEGLETVEQAELAAQYRLTEALWSKLVEQGLRERSQGRIEAFLFAPDEDAAASLAAGYVKAGWLREIEPAEDDSGRFRIRRDSQRVYLTRQAFLELVEVMMISAHRHGCAFDGFQVDVSAVQPPRRWWHFW
jgi:hypothetical protein